jgi:O-antigen ligase
MVLIIATDPHPTLAIRRLVSRIGYLLFPVSLLFIRYYGDLGRGYTADGSAMNTGVTNNKNSLGLLVLVISLIVLWNVRSLLVNKNEPNRSRRLTAQGTLLVLGMVLFWLANCSSAKACFVLGSLLIIALSLRVFRKRPIRVHVLCLALLLAAGSALLFGHGDAADALGRDSSLSGRTDLWAALIPAAPNSTIGAGFESFWNSPNVEKARRTLLNWGWSPLVVLGYLNEAHDGYVEIYLQLGWIGICLISLVLIGGYRRGVEAFRRDPELGSLSIAYIATVAVYNITEAGFRTMSLSWIFLLLAIVSAGGVNAGLFGGDKPTTSALLRHKGSRTALFNELSPQRETVGGIRRGLNSI